MPTFLALVDAVDGRQTVSIKARSLEDARSYAEMDFGAMNVRAVWAAADPSGDDKAITRTQGLDVPAVPAAPTPGRKKSAQERKAWSVREILGLIAFRLGMTAGLGAWFVGALKSSERLSNTLVDYSNVVIDSIAYVLVGVALYLIGWLLRSMLTGKRQLF